MKLDAFKHGIVTAMLIASFTFLITSLGFTMIQNHFNFTGSNRERGFDTENTFTVAYIRYGHRDTMKIKVKCWRDFQDSDNIQLTDDKGLVYLTNYQNVLMISREK